MSHATGRAMGHAHLAIFSTRREEVLKEHQSTHGDEYDTRRREDRRKND